MENFTDTAAKTIITRKEYMAQIRTGGEKDWLAHRAYYAQFVTPAVVALVVECIGGGRLMRSTDVHLNDIRLQKWDALDFFVRRLCEKSVKEAGDFWSLSQTVCIAKEAARQWIEAQAGEDKG